MKCKFMLSRLVLLLFCIVLAIPCNVYAGADVDKLTSDQLGRAEKLYKYMIANGYSAQAAAGILGNVDQESTFKTDYNSGIRSNYGFFQMSAGQWVQFKLWATTSKLDSNDITVQFKWIEKIQIEPGWASYVSYPTTEQFKVCSDVTTATEAFMAGYERCVYGTYSLTKAKLRSGYGPYKYQEGDIRVKWAGQFLQKFANVTASANDGNATTETNSTVEGDSTTEDNNNTEVSTTENSENSENSDVVDSTQPIMGERALVGCSYTESELESYVKLSEITVDIATDDSLTVGQNYTLQNWKDTVDSNLEETILVVWMRRIVTIIGILFTVWMLFLYLSYWFDRVNVFFEFSMLSTLSFGRLRISPDEYECTWQLSELVRSKQSGTMTVNHRAMLEIVIIGCLFGSLIISGTMFKIVRLVIFFILRVLGII